MAAEQDVVDIKKAVEEKKAVIGTERTMKSFKGGLLRVVYLAKNCPAETRQDIDYYSTLAGVKVIQLEHPNDELGALCKKPFSISIIGVKN